MTEVPWRQSVKQHRGEAIASLVIRLAPIGLLTPAEFLKYHFGRNPVLLPTAICGDRAAVQELAFIGGFNVDWLYECMWKSIGPTTEFAGRQLPRGWFKAGVRRLGPGVMRADGMDAWVRNEWQIRALPCDIKTGELIVEHCFACGLKLGWRNVREVYSCDRCGQDQRDAPPRYASPAVLAGAQDLAKYLQCDASAVPKDFVSLADDEFLSLTTWLAYFAALPKGLLVRPCPHEAVAGFRLMRQWPQCFDRILDEIIGNTFLDRRIAKVEAREFFEYAALAVGRISSPAAQELINGRLNYWFRARFSGWPKYRFFEHHRDRNRLLFRKSQWPASAAMPPMKSIHDLKRPRPLTPIL